MRAGIAVVMAGVALVALATGCRGTTEAVEKPGDPASVVTDDTAKPAAVKGEAEAGAAESSPVASQPAGSGPAVSAPAGVAAKSTRTFYWSMEEETPDVYPPGSDDKAYYYPVQPTMRTTDQAHSGKYSLDLSGQSWRQATFDNNTDETVWAPTDQGAIVLWWKYTGELNAGMLMQITGKCKADAKLDTNDGRSIRFHGNNELRFGPAWFKNKEPWVADRWYKVTARWRSDRAPYFSLQIDDLPAATSDTPPAPVSCKAWHHLLWGNDTRSVPPGLYLDDVEIWSTYEMTTGEG